jgi:beta-lactam-binding protein with PASTA domain
MRRAVIVLASVLALSACGGEDPAGPDVVGMSLPTAQHVLKKAGIKTTVHSDSTFGVLVPSNYVVCKEAPVNERMVRLEVSRHGC